jgi:hypothetical protein
MASARTEGPSTHLFHLLQDDCTVGADGNGTALKSVRVFGRVPCTAEEERYGLEFDARLISGEEYGPNEMIFDVTDQVKVSAPGENIEVEVGYVLPRVNTSSPVTVTTWGDEEVIQLQ